MKKPHFKLKTGSGTVKFNTADLVGHIALSRRLGLPGFNGWLPNPDPVLKRMGKDVAVYRELLRDPIVGGHVRRRKAAVARLDWRLDGDVAQAVRDTVSGWLTDLDTYTLIKDMLNATLYGYQPLEIIWQRGNLWLPEKVIAKPQEWFSFNDERQLCFSPHHLQPEPVPPYKFLCPTQEAAYDNPYGMGDLGMVFWPATFKRAGLKFWSEFTEKYGAPWLIGKEPRSNTPTDTEMLLDALEALIGNSVGTIPNDSSVEIHEATGKTGSVEAYDKLIRYCRSEIAIALLGQDQTTEKDSTHASAKAGLEVADDIRDSDSRIIESTFNQLIEYVVLLNFGDVPYPKFVLFETEETGTKERAERDKMLFDAGARFTNSYFTRAYGLETGDLAEPQATLNPNTAPNLASFAEPITAADAGIVVDNTVAEMLASGSLNQQGQALTRSLINALQSGGADTVLDRLINAYPNMDDTALQNELARLIFLAGLVGRIEAAQELAT